MNYKTENKRIIVGCDPGSDMSGVCVLEDGRILTAFMSKNIDVLAKLTNIMLSRGVEFVLEDIRPYSLRLTPQVIETCKWIGEARYRLKNSVGCNCRLITRNEVKKWVFDTYPEVCIPYVVDKIKKKGAVTSEGLARKPSFVYVDDRIVKESMTVRFKIERPAPGKGYTFGLKDHLWQALALCAFAQDKPNIPVL